MLIKTNLSSARAKLNWANSQISILDEQIGRFIQDQPYRVRERPKPKFERVPSAAQSDLFEKGRFLEIVLTREIPDEVNAGVGMVIQAQRDSLDHLAHALAKKNGAVVTTDVCFVISDSASEFASVRAKRKLRRLSEEDRRVISGLMPYKGGNDLLYSLNWLNNKSKHRELIAVAAQAESFEITGQGRAKRLLILPPGNTLCPDQQLICFEADKDVQLNLIAAVAFREIGHAHGQPVIKTLRELGRLTDSIIELFS